MDEDPLLPVVFGYISFAAQQQEEKRTCFSRTRSSVTSIFVSVEVQQEKGIVSLRNGFDRMDRSEPEGGVRPLQEAFSVCDPDRRH